MSIENMSGYIPPVKDSQREKTPNEVKKEHQKGDLLFGITAEQEGEFEEQNRPTDTDIAMVADQLMDSKKKSYPYLNEEYMGRLSNFKGLSNTEEFQKSINGKDFRGYGRYYGWKPEDYQKLIEMVVDGQDTMSPNERRKRVVNQERGTKEGKPSNYYDVLDHFSEALNNARTNPMSRMMYEQIPDDLRRMANGDNLNGTREENYPGWTDDNFKELIEKLGI